MRKQYWIVRETYKDWKSDDFRGLPPNLKSYQYFFDGPFRFELGDIFLGLNRKGDLISTIGVCVTNFYALPNKSCVHLQPRYYFRRQIPFKDIQQIVEQESDDKIEWDNLSILPLNQLIWDNLLEEISNYDSFAVEVIKNLYSFQEQRKYLDEILSIFDHYHCDSNERQEVFLILRNLLNWNPEYSEGQEELDEMLTFMKYSLHIEDLEYENRIKILDKVLYNWIRYTNLLPKKTVETLQDIKKPVLL